MQQVVIANDLLITEHSLFAQATNQPRFELFAEKETEFFLKVVDAQVTFVPDPAGKTIALILHQNGASPRGEKIH